jgi:photosystem II stability/assembly factor-like uncharacterized protein
VDPSRPDHLLDSSERALYESPDGGRTWDRLGDGAGLLAWPAPGSLVLLDAAGRVLSSSGPAAGWSRVGEVGGEPAALLATSPVTLYVALHDGTIRLSEDGGATWTTRSSP